MAITANEALIRIQALCNDAQLDTVVPSTFSAQFLIETLEQIQALCNASMTETASEVAVKPQTAPVETGPVPTTSILPHLIALARGRTASEATTEEEGVSKTRKAISQFICQDYYIHTSDLPQIGVLLGYKHNDIAEAIQIAELYGRDGAGATLLIRADLSGLDEPRLLHIVNEIFASSPHVKHLMVIDD